MPKLWNVTAGMLLAMSSVIASYFACVLFLPAEYTQGQHNITYSVCAMVGVMVLLTYSSVAGNPEARRVLLWFWVELLYLIIGLAFAAIVGQFAYVAFNKYFPAPQWQTTLYFWVSCGVALISLAIYYLLVPFRDRSS